MVSIGNWIIVYLSIVRRKLTHIKFSMRTPTDIEHFIGKKENENEEKIALEVRKCLESLIEIILHSSFRTSLKEFPTFLSVRQVLFIRTFSVTALTLSLRDFTVIYTCATPKISKYADNT